MRFQQTINLVRQIHDSDGKKENHKFVTRRRQAEGATEAFLARRSRRYSKCLSSQLSIYAIDLGMTSGDLNIYDLHA